MKKSVKAASAVLMAAMLTCLMGCPEPEGTTGTPTATETVVSGIFSEDDVFYINMETDKSPSDGNGAW